MRRFWQFAFCSLLATGIGMAQRGGGGHMGGGGIGGGFPGFVGAPGSGGRFGIGLPISGVPLPSNGVAFPNTNASFPFGLGLSAGTLGFPNGLVFNNGHFFPSTIFPNNLVFPNNAFFNLENQRFSNNSFWGWGWGVGASLQFDPLTLPGQSGNSLAAYRAPAAVVVLPPEQAHPVAHEYDQSGKEVRPAATAASGERSHSVIHEYDADGKEITPAR